MSSQQPPQIVRVAGWIWVSLGIMLTAMSVLVFAMAIVMKSFLPHDRPDYDSLSMPGAQTLGWLFEHFEAAVTLQTIFYASILVAAVFLLRARRWARTYLELVCWLGAAYIVAFTAWFAYAWASVSDTLPNAAGSQPIAVVFSTMGITMAIAAALFSLCPVGALIWLLRRPSLRSAVT